MGGVGTVKRLGRERGTGMVAFAKSAPRRGSRPGGLEPAAPSRKRASLIGKYFGRRSSVPSPKCLGKCDRGVAPPGLFNLDRGSVAIAEIGFQIGAGSAPAIPSGDLEIAAPWRKRACGMGSSFGGCSRNVARTGLPLPDL